LEIGRPPKPLYGDWSPEPYTDEQPLAPADQVIEILRQRGYLTEMDHQEEEALLCTVATHLHDQNRRPGYLFMPTYNCNLRCAYCFQDHMRTNPSFSHLLRTMSVELVDRIFTAIPQIDKFHAMPENFGRSIGFFGGEPLLAANRGIVDYIMNRAEAIGEASFWAVSNGTDLHAYKEVLGPQKISYLQITLDGPAQEHDRRRIYADGRGSFEQIADNISMALDLGVKISVRMNIDRNNIDTLPKLADEIIERGWDRYATFSTYTAPIHAANEKTDSKGTFGSWELDKALTEMRNSNPTMRVIERPDDSTKDAARRIFRSQDTPQLRATFCSAHSGMYIFDAFGDIYACWERTGDPGIRIGNITTEGGFAFNAPLNDMWRSRNVTTNPTCRKCRYALYCGGGCAVLAHETTGKFFSNHCDGFASRFRNSIAEAYLEHISDVPDQHKVERACCT
jgi:uncharacterized protein